MKKRKRTARERKKGIKEGVWPLELTHRWLVVVLQGHGDDVEANDESDEDVQVVAGAD